MYDTTYDKPSITEPISEETDRRLKWLDAALGAQEERRKMFRNDHEEAEMLRMRNPIPTQQAYAIFGMLLGTFPPAAIFYKIFGYGILKSSFSASEWWPILFLMCLAMNLMCCVMGRTMGAFVGRRIDALERGSWARMLLVTILLGMLWGLVAGMVGGSVFFIFGAIFGIIYAIPTGTLAFILFTPFHRLLARGGMIEASHLWPLAWGITLAIAALILGG